MKNNYSLYIVIVMVLAACSPKEPEYISAVPTSTTLDDLKGLVKEVKSGRMIYTQEFHLDEVTVYDTTGMWVCTQRIHGLSSYALDSTPDYRNKIWTIDSVQFDWQDIEAKSKHVIQVNSDDEIEYRNHPKYLMPNYTVSTYTKDYDENSFYLDQRVAHIFTYQFKNDNIQTENYYEVTPVDSVLVYTGAYAYDALNRVTSITYTQHIPGKLNFDRFTMPTEILSLGEDTIEIQFYYKNKTEAIVKTVLLKNTQPICIYTKEKHGKTHYNTLKYKYQGATEWTTQKSIIYLTKDKDSIIGKTIDPDTNAVESEHTIIIDFDSHHNLTAIATLSTNSKGKQIEQNEFTQVITYYNE